MIMSKNILVVDDSESIRNIVGFALSEEGYNITTANDGLDALNKLDDDSFKLIVTDLYMPNMTGLELIKEVRKIDSYKFTPILFLTTENHMGKKLEAKKAGATGWLVKPFDPEKLIRAVRKVLR